MQGAGRLARRGSRSIRPSHGSGVSRVMWRDLERLRVHPRAVDVAVQQEDGPVGHDVVEQLLGRGAAWEVGHEPAAAEDPRLLRVGAGVRRDGVAVRVDARQVVERDVQPVPARERRVDVGVWKPGSTIRPGRCRSSFASGNRSFTSGSVPTAAIRSPRTATAPAHRRAASIV